MPNVRKVDNPREEKLREHVESLVGRQDALLEYVAMMADVELPEEGEDEQVRDEG